MSIIEQKEQYLYWATANLEQPVWFLFSVCVILLLHNLTWEISLCGWGMFTIFVGQNNGLIYFCYRFLLF